MQSSFVSAQHSSLARLTRLCASGLSLWYAVVIILGRLVLECFADINVA